jgi:hypothetical protein
MSPIASALVLLAALAGIALSILGAIAGAALAVTSPDRHVRRAAIVLACPAGAMFVPLMAALLRIATA